MKADKKGYFGYSVETENNLIFATGNYKDALKAYRKETRRNPYNYIGLKGWLDEDRIETDLLKAHRI